MVTSGTITSGRRLGRTIGFPTLNLPWEPELRPRFGVYAVKVRFGEQVFPGVANYGVRPTVEREGTPAPLLETFLLEVPDGASVPGYGDFIVVEWLKFLRPEQRFESVDALREQLRLDRLAAADFLLQGLKDASIVFRDLPTKRARTRSIAPQEARGRIIVA